MCEAALDSDRAADAIGDRRLCRHEQASACAHAPAIESIGLNRVENVAAAEALPHDVGYAQQEAAEREPQEDVQGLRKIAATQPIALGNPEQQAVKQDCRLAHQGGDGATGNTCETGQQQHQATALRHEAAHKINEERTFLVKQASDLSWGMRHETETNRKWILPIAQRRRSVNAATHPESWVDL